jgi:hypothetical protein
MKRVGSLMLVCMVAGCMPVHHVSLGSDGVATPDASGVPDAAAADAELTDAARAEDHEGSDTSPREGTHADAGPNEQEDRPRSEGPTLRDAAFGSDDPSAPDAASRDGGGRDSMISDDDDARGDAGERRDDDDRP